nr:xylulose kinase-1 [Tanacetum cinerariifolium]
SDGAFGGVRDEEVVVGEGMVVTSSSLVMLTNSCLGGIMVRLIFLDRLVDEALEEFMVELFEEDDKMNYPIWQVIQNGNGPVSVTTDTNGMIKVLTPKTTKEVVARERERKDRTTLLMALPEDHLAKFHKMADAKEMWEAIKSRFGDNDKSKKMQKYLLKQQFKGFSVSASEGLHKGYDSAPQLDYDNLEQINDDDLKDMDLKWQVAMISMRIKKFHKRTSRKL